MELVGVLVLVAVAGFALLFILWTTCPRCRSNIRRGLKRCPYCSREIT